MQTLELVNGGVVRFSWKDVQSVQPHYGNAIIILSNGRAYLVVGNWLDYRKHLV